MPDACLERDRSKSAGKHPNDFNAERRASRPKVSKLAANEQLREYVQDRLAGMITRPDGQLVPGPERDLLD